MRILFVLDHPYTLDSAENVPHRRSFTAAVADAAIRGARQAGHEIDLVDLAADGFDPVMSRDDLVAWRLKSVVDPVVADYQRRLLAADHVVFAFPVWWEAMPAATKGFLDRVLTKGVVFEEIAGAKGNPFRNLMPRLGGVTVLSIMTTPDAAYRWWFRDPLTKIMFKGTFGKIGVKNLRWVNYAAITEKTVEQRERMLRDTEQRFVNLRAAASPQRQPARV
ncbi:NAD(P)H-dependent oxidoreductase [Agromyces sp. Leaf222]|uniref:NAD(P)H-dependent oxidoreductase n=1 Tax=Agromyces sp. Leaf222 TaxID=1735688 RepID=UPI0006F808B6|nr:NAD(P)H-dependent oxidoreductase [Agromyces sp. Leaf222]KQM82562.1 NAD(P)H dehydrogenase [Agromyces sp. Leaf222]